MTPSLNQANLGPRVLTRKSPVFPPRLPLCMKKRPTLVPLPEFPQRPQMPPTIHLQQVAPSLQFLLQGECLQCLLPTATAVEVVMWTVANLPQLTRAREKYLQFPLEYPKEDPLPPFQGVLLLLLPGHPPAHPHPDLLQDLPQLCLDALQRGLLLPSLEDSPPLPRRWSSSDTSNCLQLIAVRNLRGNS